jgi:transcription antitermination factor NusG
MLEYLEVTHFLPLVNEVRKWSDRKQLVVLPLFPGYLFVRIPILNETQLQVLRVPGITRFVGDSNGPLAIPDGEIESLRTVLARKIPCSLCPFLKVGDRVRVVRGALSGIEGTLTRCKPGSKLIISVEMIQRSVAIDVSVSDVEPVFVVQTQIAAPPAEART